MPKAKPKSKPPKTAAVASVTPQPRFSMWLTGVLLVLATVLAYQPVWHAGFIWDDDAYVTNNMNLRSVDGLRQIWFNLTATPQYYPLVHTSFWFEYHLWSLNPLGYHVVNVLLHIFAAILLWRVLERLKLPGAWLAAAIFALHPVAVESVAWVTERKNVLATVFYFAAALAYLRWMEKRTDGRKSNRFSLLRYFLALALFACALLSKTVTCSLPAAMLLVIWWKQGRITGRDALPLLPFFVAGAGMGFMTSWLERTHVGANGPDWDFSFPERCLIAGRALWFYAGKLLWPENLMFNYPRWQLNVGAWWQWLFPVAAVAVVMLLWSLRQRITRGPLAAILYFAGTLFPALGFTNVFPMRFSFVADHFQYLASVGLMILASVGITKVFSFLGKRNLPIKPAGCGALLLILGALTWSQCRMYANVETLWQTTVDRNPASWLAQNNLGSAFLNQGQLKDAIRQFQETLQLKPDYAEAHYNLATALLKQDQTDEAIRQFQEAIRLKPDYTEALDNLGNALLKQGQISAAVRQFQEAIRLKPDDALAHYDLGTTLLNQGQINEAILQFQEVIRLKPDDALAYNNLGHAFGNQGRINEAILQFQEAIRLKPDYAEAHMNLGTARAIKGQINEAISEFQEAIRLKPDDTNAQNHLAKVLEMKKEQDARVPDSVKPLPR